MECAGQRQPVRGGALGALTLRLVVPCRLLLFRCFQFVPFRWGALVECTVERRGRCTTGLPLVNMHSSHPHSQPVRAILEGRLRHEIRTSGRLLMPWTRWKSPATCERAPSRLLHSRVLPRSRSAERSRSLRLRPRSLGFLTRPCLLWDEKTKPVTRTRRRIEAVGPNDKRPFSESVASEFLERQ